MSVPSNEPYSPEDLARLLEAASAARLRGYVEAQGNLSHEVVIEVGGGVVAFGGGASPVSRAVGLGLNGPVSAAELERVEAFFSARGIAPRFDLCPLADALLVGWLRERGYQLDGFLNVLYRRLLPDDTAIPRDGNVEIVPVTTELRDVWLTSVAAGFAGEAPPPDDTVELIRPTLDSPSSRRFLAVIDGQPAGGGAYAVKGPVAELGSAATHPDFRRRGVQSALIEARLAAAAAEGCTLASLATAPGSGAQRNAERAGFRVAYTRISLVAPPRST